MQPYATWILGTRIDALSWEVATAKIAVWADRRESRMICLCNVHVATSARKDAELRAALIKSDINAPDGAPLAWLMRRRHWPEEQRSSGPDLMWRILTEAAQQHRPVFFYGGTESTLSTLLEKVRAALPALRIAGAISPPFRDLSKAEEQQTANQIMTSGAQIVLVGLGCPKQEKWMARHQGIIPAVMLGVGAAFDYHAGTLARAPQTWQHAGLEWLYRLLKEPRRLLRRYLITNAIFLCALPTELWRAQAEGELSDIRKT